MENIHVKLWKIGPVVQEEMLFKEKVYGWHTKTNHNSSNWAFGSGELIKQNFFQNAPVILEQFLQECSNNVCKKTTSFISIPSRQALKVSF